MKPLPALLNPTSGWYRQGGVARHLDTMQSSFQRFVFPFTLWMCVMSIRATGQQQAQPIGQLYASDASVKGSVMLANSGTTVLSGSSIEAGTQAAMLKLDRGGSLQVCEGTKLSITSSNTGRQMLFSLNSGNLELNYPLGTEADTLLTPDVRVLLPGPGTVHVAVRVASNGDTCVQSLPWNASAVVVSESMGDATYQVKPDEAVLFKGGHLNQAIPSKSNCGCPKMTPTEVAKATAVPSPPARPAASETPASPILPPASHPQNSEQMASAPPAGQHLTGDVPLVFHGDDPMPDLRPIAVTLKLENTRIVPLEPTVLPPPTSNKPDNKKAPPATQSAQNQPATKNQSHGFFSKVGAFFASIFH